MAAKARFTWRSSGGAVDEAITIEPAKTEAGRTAIANMLQLYIHDFADFMSPERKGLLSDEGLY